MENSNEKNITNRRHYIIFRKKAKHDLNNEVQEDNFICKTNQKFKNKNNFVASKINNKLDNKYDDNNIIENNDEFNIDDSLKNFHIEKSSNVRTLILNDDKIKYINSNKYIHNPKIIKRNTYINRISIIWIGFKIFAL